MYLVGFIIRIYHNAGSSERQIKNLLVVANLELEFIVTKLNSVALVRERTIPTERPPPVSEVSANFCG